jgi:hypothetical protein
MSLKKSSRNRRNEHLVIQQLREGLRSTNRTWEDPVAGLTGCDYAGSVYLYSIGSLHVLHHVSQFLLDGHCRDECPRTLRWIEILIADIVAGQWPQDTVGIPVAQSQLPQCQKSRNEESAGHVQMSQLCFATESPDHSDSQIRIGCHTVAVEDT